MAAWYEELEEKARAALEHDYGRDWQVQHDIYVSTAGGWARYECRKCPADLTCLDMVNTHIHSKKHQKRHQNDLYTQKLQRMEQVQQHRLAGLAQQPCAPCPVVAAPVAYTLQREREAVPPPMGVVQQAMHASTLSMSSR
eukprot:CAMPEP_0168454814 /NCGR_PEP_ID=MMETSP0228-20121227/50417_1 /TAXON_ID=133427 /ORGANISM="Protoceratium reticulatum, Strain CCCM 535 (=CCMP 1889)" /LENGTH=139 /DNA_ID=CAMNT_0008469617 /DNA_START=141 /DNA_END=557 /DNA_ORIENTATION=+